MAPKTDDIEKIRNCFRTAKQVQESVKALSFENFPSKELSLGMSQDVKVAIEEGATILWLGNKITG